MALQAVLVSWGWRGTGRWLTVEEVMWRRQVEEEWRLYAAQEAEARWMWEEEEARWRWEEERARLVMEEAARWAEEDAWLRRLWEEAGAAVEAAEEARKLEEARRLRLLGKLLEDAGAAEEAPWWTWWRCCWGR